MKAVKILAERHMVVVDLPEPELKEGEVLLRLQYVGFCGSDLNTWLGRNPMVHMPVIPGHEIGALVERVGDCVPGTLKPGDVVTVNPYTNCGQCAACRRGRFNACQHNETLGVQRDGAMSARIAVPWQKVIPAEGLDPRTCALIEPMSVGFHAVSRASVTDSDVVMVIGCGMVGMGAIARAALRGATVIAADIDDDKLVLALRAGAAYVINSRSEDVHARLLELTSGLGPDVVIEAVGSTVTYQMAVSEVAFTGRVICIGYAKSDISFQTKQFVQKEIDIRGSRNALPEDFRSVIRFLRRGTYPVDDFVSRVVTPDEAQEAMAGWADNPGKVFRILVEF
ncbi:MAG: zinc-binding alcohol dehydrogenase family protein [Bacteroidales bacterium]|nr:zinc-binding alcohol dehydrogenase family protein [Bacteroidales bacterium]